MNRGFVFILILAVGLVVTSCLRQGKQNVTYDFTPLDSIITRVRDKDCVKNRVKRAKIVRFTLC